MKFFWGGRSVNKFVKGIKGVVNVGVGGVDIGVGYGAYSADEITLGIGVESNQVSYYYPFDGSNYGKPVGLLLDE